MHVALAQTKPGPIVGVAGVVDFVGQRIRVEIVVVVLQHGDGFASVPRIVVGVVVVVFLAQRAVIGAVVVGGGVAQQVVVVHCCGGWFYLWVVVCMEGGR